MFLYNFFQYIRLYQFRSYSLIRDTIKIFMLNSVCVMQRKGCKAASYCKSYVLSFKLIFKANTVSDILMYCPKIQFHCLCFTDCIEIHWA